MLHIGLDVGSTTVKVVVMNEKLNTIYTSYQRHFSDVRKTIYECIQKVIYEFPNEEMTIALTGSRCIICCGIIRNRIYPRSCIMQKSYRKIYTKNGRSNRIRAAKMPK